jgi:hypothetical protein
MLATSAREWTLNLLAKRCVWVPTVWGLRDDAPVVPRFHRSSIGIGLEPPLSIEKRQKTFQEEVKTCCNRLLSWYQSLHDSGTSIAWLLHGRQDQAVPILLPLVRPNLASARVRPRLVAEHDSVRHRGVLSLDCGFAIAGHTESALLGEYDLPLLVAY